MSLSAVEEKRGADSSTVTDGDGIEVPSKFSNDSAALDAGDDCRLALLKTVSSLFGLATRDADNNLTSDRLSQTRHFLEPSLITWTVCSWYGLLEVA